MKETSDLSRSREPFEKSYHRSVLIFKKLTLLFTCGIFFFLLILPACAGGYAEIVILHTNDFHGHLLPHEDNNFVSPPETVGGAAYIATKVKDFRKKYPGKVVLLDAGDMAQGTLLSNMFLGKPVIEYMNYLRYDAVSLGNHEFDWGMKALMDMVEWARFPVLCANIYDENKKKLPSYVKPYIIVEREGLKIGIIGVITPHTYHMSFPQNVCGLKFLEPEEPVKRCCEELQNKGISVIGILSHLGYEGDKALASKVQGLSFIVGGHTHTAMKKTEKVNKTLIVQAGSYGKYLGNLRLIIEKDTGKVIFYNMEDELIPTAP